MIERCLNCGNDPKVAKKVHKNRKELYNRITDEFLSGDFVHRSKIYEIMDAHDVAFESRRMYVRKVILELESEGVIITRSGHNKGWVVE